MSDQIDAGWNALSGWGGVKHYAMKLIFCYYPEVIIPIFKTEHLEHFVNVLRLWENIDERARGAFRKEYADLSMGQKYTLLNNILVESKKNRADLKDLDNALYMRFLYEAFPPSEVVTPEKVVEPMIATRMLFSPVNELGVVTLFAMYHRELGFPYILKIKRDYPDGIVIDEFGEVKTIEFELFASNFLIHGHDAEKCDHIICWQNDLDESTEEERIKTLRKKVLALKERLGKLEE